jgi:hypothetical protein
MMKKSKIRKRQRFFVAGEGETEQSLVKWLQKLCDQYAVFVHLDYTPLGGGGYRSMLDKADTERTIKTKRDGDYVHHFIMLDTDLGHGTHDPWTVQKLKEETTKIGFTPCLAYPDVEGLLAQLHGEKGTPLKSIWSDYRKPPNAYQLQRRYTRESLIHLDDAGYREFLGEIGLVI